MEPYLATDGALPAQPGYIAHYIDDSGELWRKAVAAWLIQHQRQADDDDFSDIRSGRLLGVRIVAGIVSTDELWPADDHPQFLVVTDPLDDVDSVVNAAIARRNKQAQQTGELT